MTRKLGCNQLGVLDGLKRHGSWYSSCGWIWDTPEGTRRILETLVKRGLVTKTESDRAWGGTRIPATVYSLTIDQEVDEPPTRHGLCMHCVYDETPVLIPCEYHKVHP